MRLFGPPFSLRLGHISALALLTQFTTEMPLRYLTREGEEECDIADKLREMCIC